MYYVRVNETVARNRCPRPANAETRRDIKHHVPDLTLNMAMRVLRSAFAKPMLNEQEAIDLIDYHRERNETAHQSLAEELLL